MSEKVPHQPFEGYDVTIPREVVQRSTEILIAVLTGKMPFTEACIKPDFSRLASSSGAPVVESFDPQSLVDLYHLLPGPNRHEFLRLLGRCSVAEVVFVVLSEMPPSEQKRFVQLHCDELLANLLPVMTDQAVRTAIETLDLKLTEEQIASLNDTVFAESAKKMAFYNESISELVKHELKESRNRKSASSTVDRNVEICDLRLQGMTQGQLAKQFNTTDANIRMILKDEAKWRRLKAQADRSD